jgi:hypothetical protein
MPPQGGALSAKDDAGLGKDEQMMNEAMMNK